MDLLLHNAAEASHPSWYTRIPNPPHHKRHVLCTFLSSQFLSVQITTASQSKSLSSPSQRQSTPTISITAHETSQTQRRHHHCIEHALRNSRYSPLSDHELDSLQIESDGELERRKKRVQRLWHRTRNSNRIAERTLSIAAYTASPRIRHRRRHCVN